MQRIRRDLHRRGTTLATALHYSELSELLRKERDVIIEQTLSSSPGRPNNSAGDPRGFSTHRLCPERTYPPQ